jgi:hypothetical protein
MPNRPTSDRFRATAERSPQFAHLSLDGLRAYRRTLTTEEGRVSYWRRILQARLDLVRSAGTGSVPAVDSLRNVFAEDRLGNGRHAILSVLPVDDMPPIPDLVPLWEREPATDSDPASEADNAALAHDLVKAEAQLSAYRTALHKRLAAATGELIARYREDPTLCLSVLPTEPVPAATTTAATHSGRDTAVG